MTNTPSVLTDRQTLAREAASLSLSLLAFARLLAGPSAKSSGTDADLDQRGGHARALAIPSRKVRAPR